MSNKNYPGNESFTITWDPESIDPSLQSLFTHSVSEEVSQLEYDYGSYKVQITFFCSSWGLYFYSFNI